MKKLMLAVLMGLAARASAVSNVQAPYLAAKPAASAFNYDIDVQQFSQFSLQVDYSDAHPSTKTFVGSLAGDTASDAITLSGHNLPLGLGVVLSTNSNYALGGLTHGATYYVVPSGDNAVKLATSLSNAIAGTVVDLTALPTLSSATFTLTPQQLASAASDGIVYQGSNDGVTFYSLSQSSVPYDSATTGALTSFVDYSGKLLRLKFTGPTTGALSINATLNGRR